MHFSVFISVSSQFDAQNLFHNKFYFIVIIASCLDVRCVLTVQNILYKFENTQRDGLSQMKLLIPLPTYPKCEKRGDL